MVNKEFKSNSEHNSFATSEEEQMPLGLGVIFIKSRKSDDKIWQAIDEMKALASSTYVEIADVIVDESSGLDIDREEIDLLSDWIENSPVGILILQSIYDISKDPDDLDKFLERAERFHMIIVDVKANRVISPFEESEDEED